MNLALNLLQMAAPPHRVFFPPITETSLVSTLECQDLDLACMSGCYYRPSFQSGARAWCTWRLVVAVVRCDRRVPVLSQTTVSSSPPLPSPVPRRRAGAVREPTTPRRSARPRRRHAVFVPAAGSQGTLHAAARRRMPREKMTRRRRAQCSATVIMSAPRPVASSRPPAHTVPQAPRRRAPPLHAGPPHTRFCVHWRRLARRR